MNRYGQAGPRAHAAGILRTATVLLAAALAACTIQVVERPPGSIPGHTPPPVAVNRPDHDEGPRAPVPEVAREHASPNSAVHDASADHPGHPRWSRANEHEPSAVAMANPGHGGMPPGQDKDRDHGQAHKQHPDHGQHAQDKHAGHDHGAHGNDVAMNDVQPHGSTSSHGGGEQGNSAGDHGHSSEQHGHSNGMHGHPGNQHGNSGATHGQSGEQHGNAGPMHGQSDEQRGNPDNSHGHSGAAHDSASGNSQDQPQQGPGHQTASAQPSAGPGQSVVMAAYSTIVGHYHHGATTRQATIGARYGASRVALKRMASFYNFQVAADARSGKKLHDLLATVHRLRTRHSDLRQARLIVRSVQALLSRVHKDDQQLAQYANRSTSALHTLQAKGSDYASFVNTAVADIAVARKSRETTDARIGNGLKHVLDYYAYAAKLQANHHLRFKHDKPLLADAGESQELAKREQVMTDAVQALAQLAPADS